MSKLLKIIVKIALIIAAFYLVSHHSDIHLIYKEIYKINKIWLALALISLAVSFVVSAFRTAYYYQITGINYSKKNWLIIHLTGMFYNIFLPGGIGGDGYKIILMKKLANIPKLQSLRIILANRANGLWLLANLTIILTLFSDRLSHIAFSIKFILFILMNSGYLLVAKILFKETTDFTFKAGIYSFFIQSLMLLSSWCLLVGLGEQMFSSATTNYLILFMVSSIVAVLPISIGGAGLREITFLYGTNFMELNTEIGIAFSLVYFFLNMVLSLIGGYFVFVPNKSFQKDYCNIN